MEGQQAKIDIQEIYNLLCPDCRKKVVSAVASKVATDAIEREVEKQLNKDRKEVEK